MADRDPSRRWADELAAWRIRPEILAGAAESPYGYPVEFFRSRPGPPLDSPTVRRAREALPTGGSVLDVGFGGGAASLPLAPPAERLIGLDESPALLAEFSTAAGHRDVAAETVLGRWPDVASLVPVADVAVCAHVAYNVADLAGFARALDAHARRRVVLELTAVHPWVPLGPLWQRVHGEPRPAGPSAGLAAQVLVAAGIPAVKETFRRPPGPEAPVDATLAFARRRLCLPPQRWSEVHAEDIGGLQVDDLVTLWWDVNR